MTPVPPRWRHQEEAFRFVRERWSHKQHGAMLAMAMGTGKSRVAAELATDLGVEQHLIVCPLRVVPVWEQQLARYAPGHFHVLALDDRRDWSVTRKYQEAARLYAWSQEHHKPVAIVVNYDTARMPPFGSWAATRIWGLVTADEIHRCKEPRSYSSRWLAKVGLMAHRRLGLTGTPMPHEPTDIWGQFRFLNPFHLEKSFGHFKSRYAVKGGFFDKQVIAWQHLDELEERFRELAFRVTDEVLDLPEEMDEVRVVDMGAEGARIYQEMEREMIAWISAQAQVTAANAMVRLLRLAQITGGGLEDESGSHHQFDHAKEELLAELLTDLDEPVVVFCRFKPDLAAVHRAARAAGKDCLELSGRRDELARWQRPRPEDDKACVLAVQIQSGGVGVDLTRARVAVYYSLDFSLANYRQSRARIRRPPQQRACVFYHLQIRNSVDQMILGAIRRRGELVDSVLGEVGVVNDVIEDLRRKGALDVVAR